ncbi:MAG: IPTL-CTERM sorting domain-containing protein [candidate division Zixibacteria bacterium]
MKKYTNFKIAVVFSIVALFALLLPISSAIAAEAHGTTIVRDADGCTVRMTVQIAVDIATQAEFDDVKTSLEACFNRTCEIPCENPEHGHCDVICTIDVRKLADIPDADKPKYHIVSMTNDISSAVPGTPNSGRSTSDFERANSNGISGTLLHRAWCHEVLHLCGLEDKYCDLRRGDPDNIEVLPCDPPGPIPCDCEIADGANRCTKPCTGFENDAMATLSVDMSCDNVIAIVELAGLNSCPVDPCCPIPEEGSSTNKDIYQGMLEDWGTNIEIVLFGQHPILNHFDGSPPQWGFQTFEILTSEYSTSLRWSNPYSPIPPGNTVHVGWVTPTATTIMDAGWRDDILWDPIWDGTIFEIGHEILPLTESPGYPTLRLTYGIPTTQPVWITELYYLLWDYPFPLDLLKPENPFLDPTSPEFAMTPIAIEPIEMFPGDAIDIEIVELSLSGQPIVIRFSGSGNNSYVEYGQHIITAPTADVPTLSEWGMMLMGLLLLVIGTVAVVRRRRRKAVLNEA